MQYGFGYQVAFALTMLLCFSNVTITASTSMQQNVSIAIIINNFCDVLDCDSFGESIRNLPDCYFEARLSKGLCSLATILLIVATSWAKWLELSEHSRTNISSLNSHSSSIWLQPGGLGWYVVHAHFVQYSWSNWNCSAWKRLRMAIDKFNWRRPYIPCILSASSTRSSQSQPSCSPTWCSNNREEWVRQEWKRLDHQIFARTSESTACFPIRIAISVMVT